MISFMVFHVFLILVLFLLKVDSYYIYLEMHDVSLLAFCIVYHDMLWIL